MLNRKELRKDTFENFEGIILESRGGAKGSKGERNTDYKEKLVNILESLKFNKEEGVQIYIASRSKKYASLDDRLLFVDNEFSFDFENIVIEEFLPKLNKAIMKSGQEENTEGGNATKRLFFKLTDEFTEIIKKLDELGKL